MLDKINFKAKTAAVLGAAVLAATAFAPGISLADEDNENAQIAENANAVATELDNSNNTENANNENSEGAENSENTENAENAESSETAETAENSESSENADDSENAEGENANAEGSEGENSDGENAEGENSDSEGGEEADGEDADNENKELTEEEKAEKKKKFDELIDFKLTEDQLTQVNTPSHPYQVRSEYSDVFRVVAGDQIKAAMGSVGGVLNRYDTSNCVSDDDNNYTYGFLTVDKDGKTILGGSKVIKDQDKVTISDDQVKKAVADYVANNNWKVLEMIVDRDMDPASGDDTAAKVGDPQEEQVNGWKAFKWTGSLERKGKVYPLAIYAIINGDTATWVTVSSKNFQTGGNISTTAVEKAARDLARSYMDGKNYMEGGSYLIPAAPVQDTGSTSGTISAEDLGLGDDVQVVTE